MDINEFIGHVAEQFDDATNLTPEAKFREVEGWSSIVALSIIAMVDEVYEVTLKGDDVKAAQTIQDLFNTVQAKKS